MNEMQEWPDNEPPDVSQITDYLYLSSLPRDEDAEHIASLGVQLVVSMPVRKPPEVYQNPPFQFVHCPTLDAPWVAISQKMLRRGVAAALPVIENGDAVLVHCNQGKHRSVAMACCILVAIGYTSEEAMRLVKEKREIADPYIGYVRKRIEVFQSDWHAKSQSAE